MAAYQCLHCEEFESNERCCEKQELVSINSMPGTILKSKLGFEEIIGCFRAAEIEGLSEALAETTDFRLKDLVERRLMYALHAANRCEIDTVKYDA